MSLVRCRNASNISGLTASLGSANSLLMMASIMGQPRLFDKQSYCYTAKYHICARLHKKTKPAISSGFVFGDRHETVKFILNIKFYTLRECQAGSPVNGSGLSAHISFPCIGAGFASTARIFFTAKGTANFCTRGTNINVGNTAITAAC